METRKPQKSLFEITPSWASEWNGEPEPEPEPEPDPSQDFPVQAEDSLQEEAPTLPSNDPRQAMLLDIAPAWADHWRGMPELRQKNLTPKYSMLVHFEKWSDVQEFARLLTQTITPLTRSLWYPKPDIGRFFDLGWVQPDQVIVDEPIAIANSEPALADDIDDDLPDREDENE